jgi:glycosyltransferase involved in cell wall biosynthesis
MNVSIVLPTSRPPDLVQPTIASILPQLLSPDELIIVVNGVGVERDVKSYLISNDFATTDFAVVFDDVPGLLSGRHRGLREARHEVVVFVDDDILPQPGWRDALLDCFTDSNVHMVGGPCRPQLGLNFPSWIDSFWGQFHNGGRWCGYLSLIDCGDRAFEIDPMYVWGLNFSVRRDSLLEVGGFHPDGLPWEHRRFRGDGETAVSAEFKKRGWKAMYEPRAAVTHVVPPERLTVEYFEKRAYLQGISDSYTKIRASGNFRKLPSQTKWGQFGARVKNRLSSWNRTPLRGKEKSEILSVEQTRVQKAYSDGFYYHQREVSTDPSLLAWVLKENYWDYSYPETASE